MRIIAGAARGRQLAVPQRGTRPTPDRVREALFSTLQSMLSAEDRAWSSVHVLDAYAGSGALGLEALSRGAASVVLVEKRPAAAAVIRANAERVGLPGASVVACSVRALAGRPPQGPPVALVLLDPPYETASATIREELEALAAGGWLEPDALVVVERPRSASESPLPWDEVDRREYGDTVLWYGRADQRGKEPGDA